MSKTITLFMPVTVKYDSAEDCIELISEGIDGEDWKIYLTIPQIKAIASAVDKLKEDEKKA